MPTSYDKSDPILFSLIISMIVLSVVFIILRFWSRLANVSSKSSMGRRFWWDDWFALASLVSQQ